jgi:hypothetical protein
MRLRAVVLVGTIVILTLTAPNTAAQVPTGAIDGRVTDADGRLLAGVAVKVSGPALLSERIAVTGDRGAFRLPAVPPSDEYTVTFSLAGFQTLVRDEITVVIGVTTTLNVQLELGAFEEVLTVTGDSPVVDLKSTTLGVNVHETMLQSVPNARDVWVVLEETPAMVMDRFNVGGSESGQQSSFSAGAGPSQNSFNYDGIEITDMAATGASSAYFPYDALQEIQVSSQSSSAEISTPGVHLNIITKSGTNQFHGMGAYYFQNASFQSNNITQDLIDQGVEEGDEFKEYNDYSLSLGGPILRDKLTFFIHHSVQEPAVYPIGFYMPDGSRGVDVVTLTYLLAKIDWQITSSTRLSASSKWDSKQRPWRNATAYERHGVGTLWYQDSPVVIPQIHFSTLFSDRAFLDVSYGQMNMDFPLEPDANNQGGVSMYEYRSTWDDAPLDDWVYGYNQSYYRYQGYLRDRMQANANYSHFVDGWIGGDHELKAGLSWFDFTSTTDEYSFGGVRQGYRYGQPYNIRVENHPQAVEYSEQSIGFYIQDTATFGNWTVNLGLRGDQWEVYLPAQQGLETPHCDYYGGRFPQFCAREFDAQRDLVNVFNVAPRLGVVWDVTGTGRTALKASWGRYYHNYGNWLANFVNPNSYIYFYTRWEDLNGDNLWQYREEGEDPYAIYTSPENSIYPDLKQPYTDELTFSVDHRIMEDLSISASVTLRNEKDLAEDIDASKPYSAYTPVEFVDPEIGPYIVYELDEDYVGVPTQWYVTNPGTIDGKPFENSYEALTLKLTKRYSNNWHMMSSYTYSKTMGWRTDAGDMASSVGDSPNDDLYAYGRPFYDRPHLLKVAGSYVFNFGFNVGAFIRYQSGEPFARSIESQRRMNQGWEVVRFEERGAQRYDSVFTLDLRIAQRFSLGPTELEIMVDGFNLTNENTTLDMGHEVNASYGDIYQILPPRIFRVGVKYSF